MKKFQQKARNRNQAGFTLIELMIVVGIIGVLAMIAIPNYETHMARTRQSEAKVALAAIYGAEKAFYAEYAAYAGSMDGIGYAPEGQRRFYLVGWESAHSGTVTGYEGVLTTASYPVLSNPLSCLGAPSTLGAQLVGDAQQFSVVATGCIRRGQATQDTWTMNEMKVLANTAIGI